MAKFSLDLTNDTAEAVDAGGRVPAGWYKAVLQDVTDDAKSGKTVLEFHITDGPLKDARVFERLSDPELMDTEKGKRVALQRVKLFAGRLGLLRTDDFGRQADVDMADAISAECVIQVVHRAYKDAGGTPQVAIELDFAGVYPPDHAKIPAEVRKALALPPAKTTDGGRAAPQAQAAATPPAQTAAAPAGIDVSDL